MPRSALRSCVRIAALLAALHAAPTAARAQDPAPAPAPAPEKPIAIPAASGYAHPDPEAMERRRDGTVARVEGSLVFYVEVATTGWLSFQLERTANPPAAKVRLAFDANPAEV